MKDDVRLGYFITFILLAVAPKNPSAALQDLVPGQPGTPQLLHLIRFLEAALGRVRGHELPQANRPAEFGLIFRVGVPE